MYKIYIKRIIDFTVALVGLMIIFPIVLLLMLILAIANRGTPLFFQERPGRLGKVFKLVKFKTMNNKRDLEGNLLPDKMRITPIGRFIRTSSLDELPQLINVLTGDMSLIGPRPLLVKYLPLYNSFQKRRHEVRPGITGWAQVNGRNALSWDKKFELDVWYVDNLSFGFDVKIIWLTLKKVVVREGINASEGTTMTSFKGNN